MISITDNPQLTLITADKIFIDSVCDRITVYGQIPYTVPQKLVIDIIKDSARYFFKWNWRATDKSFYRLTKESILDYTQANPNVGYENMRGYLVQLPSYVQVVYEIHEANKQNWQLSEKIIENAQLAQRSSPYGQSIMGINSSLYIVDAMCAMIEAQAFQSTLGTTVPFSFNPLTKQLTIEKEINDTLLLETLCNVDIQVLYNDDLFKRHVIGCVKRELKRVLGGHTFLLPGGVTMNAEEVCNNLEDIEKVEDIIKAGSGMGDIIMYR